jgi:hypothetical protein
MGDQCPDCGDEYQRVNTHLAKSDCEGEGAKTEIECENCGDVFSEYKYRINSDRDRDGTKYCSESCAAEGMREGKSVPCNYCGAMTYKSPSHLKNNDRYHCSEECENKWRSEYMSGADSPNRVSHVALVCDVCGSGYTVKPSKASESRYCSRDCQFEGQRNEVVTRQCSWCSDDITRKIHHFRGETAFCDTECKSAYLSKNRQGDANPAWKGGKRIVTRVRSCISERSWNKIAAEKRAEAGHKCENCGDAQPDRKLSVHHIIPLASGGTHEDWNLMVLCAPCHRRIENKTRNFTQPHLFSPVDG